MANKILRGLPSEAYTDKNFWDKECNTVFVNNWVFAGFAHELKNIGDVVPIKVADQPILLLKNTKKEIMKRQGKNNIWVCGSYLGFGFHEDGIQSGLIVSEDIIKKARPWKVKEGSNRIAV